MSDILPLQELDMMTEEELNEYLNSLPSTEAGIPSLGISVNNVPQLEFDCEYCDVLPGNVTALEAVTMTPTVTQPVDTVREYEMFGVTLNDKDDAFSILALLLLASVVYIGKCSIDHWFACRLARFTKSLDDQ